MESRIKSFTSWNVFTTAAGKWAVRVDGVLSEFFEIHSGVGQNCVLSPLLFGIVMDWILKTTMKDRAGIKWIDGLKLSDVDFAYDIAFLEYSWDWLLTWQRPRSWLWVIELENNRQHRSWIKRNRRVSRILLPGQHHHLRRRLWQGDFAING